MSPTHNFPLFDKTAVNAISPLIAVQKLVPLPEFVLFANHRLVSLSPPLLNRLDHF